MWNRNGVEIATPRSRNEERHDDQCTCGHVTRLGLPSSTACHTHPTCIQTAMQLGSGCALFLRGTRASAAIDQPEHDGPHADAERQKSLALHAFAPHQHHSEAWRRSLAVSAAPWCQHVTAAACTLPWSRATLELYIDDREKRRHIPGMLRDISSTIVFLSIACRSLLVD